MYISMGNLGSLIFRKLIEEGRMEDFLNFLTFLSINKGYSIYNSALVYAQRPGTLYFETERTWAERYGRFLKPSAIPIVILQPFGPDNFVYDLEDTYGKEFYRYTPEKLPTAGQNTGSGNMLKALRGAKEYGSVKSRWVQGKKVNSGCPIIQSKSSARMGRKRKRLIPGTASR